ncbi:SH3 domain-containing protein [Desulforegula conservatrix]|uniref:SH3 domain-containing protein n=1 Tax=Desulforegula conservatrix TaxID=153026 RepID=UPI000428C620|nr:SH3 domain-containing protein [Desulforegula conservatrix]
MKKTKSLIIAVCLVLFVAAVAFAASKMSVQIKEAQLRATPDYLGKVTGKASYGDQVNIEGTQGAWKKVKTVKGAQSGWMHDSALSEKEIRMSAGDKDVKIAASSSELQLAGKGFSKEVENEYKKKNSAVTYKWVDQMERIKISQPQIQKFMKEGELK